MLIKFNPSIAGYTNASIGTNKNTQGQPAFGLNFEKALKTAKQIVNLPATRGSEAQRLLDALSYEVNRAGTKLKQELQAEARKLSRSNKSDDNELAELLDVLA